MTMASGPIALVTDSTADIPDHLSEKYKIHIIPNILIIGENTYLDGVDISRQEFYERLPQMDPLPTTGTPSIIRFQQAYEAILSNGASHIISIHAASRLSGIFDTATSAANDFPGRVTTIDSRFLSLGLGFQCIDTAVAVDQGADIGEALQVAQRARRRARVIAMLDTVEYVRRSGRVSWARARIGNLLNMKYFIELKDGNVQSLGHVRTRLKGIQQLKVLIRKEGAMARTAILHTNAEEDALSLVEDLYSDSTPKPEVVNVTTVIGTHVGPNGLGFAGLAV